MSRPSLRSLFPFIALCSLAALAGCGSSEEIYVEPQRAPEAREVDFTVEINTAHPEFDSAWLNAVEAATHVEGGAEGLSVRALAKRASNRSEVVLVEVLLENTSEQHLTAASLRVETDGELFDLTTDPFGAATDQRVFPIGGIMAGGQTWLRLGVPASGSLERLSLTLSGETTERLATHSAPIAVSPDGAEVWVSMTEADRVVVLDAATHERLEQLDVPGNPRGLAISSDGALVLVARASDNAVVVIDRLTREVVQTFGEEIVGREPRSIVITPDGSRAIITAFVGDRVTILARRGDRYELERTVAVGRRPAGLSVSPDSSTALIAHFLPRHTIRDNEAWISVLDVATGSVHEEAIRDLLNIDGSECLGEALGVSPSRVESEAVANQLAGVFMHPSGSYSWIPNVQAGPAPILEQGPNAVELSVGFEPRPAEAAPGFLTILDSRVPAETKPLRQPAALDSPRERDYLDCQKHVLQIEGGVNETAASNSDLTSTSFVAFDAQYTGLAPMGAPRFVTFTPDGRRALVLSYVSDVLNVRDAASWVPTARDDFLLSGDNPIGLAVSPDGDRGFVTYENSTFVSVLDLTGLNPDPEIAGHELIRYQFRDAPEFKSGTIGLTARRMVRDVSALPERPPVRELATVDLVDEDPMEPVLRRGKVLFTSSNVEKYPELSATTMTACASCHPDGRADGTLWTTAEGERRTISLDGGVDGRGWLHISSTHRNIRDFVDVTTEQRLGASLSDEDLDALAHYVATGIPHLQPPAQDEALVLEGQALFEEKCADCHSGPRYTSGDPSASEPFAGGAAPARLYNIGTAVDTAYATLGSFFESLFPETDAVVLSLMRGDRVLGAEDPLQPMLDFRPRPDRARGDFKAPALAGIHDQVLFLHDGRFDSVEETVRFMAEVTDRPLDEAEVRAISAFVRTL